MTISKDILEQSFNFINAMRKGGVPAFQDAAFSLSDRDDVHNLVSLAKRYHKIQEHDCNGTKTDRMTKDEASLEKQIKAIAEKFGLKAQFWGDPRGYCVKLHAPNGDVYNTWGGAETGYGIG